MTIKNMFAIFCLCMGVVAGGPGFSICVGCIVAKCGGVAALCGGTCSIAVAAWYPCMAVCMGINCSPCAVLCTATAATCFGNDTAVTTQSGLKMVEDLKEGDLVRGQNGFEALQRKQYMRAEPGGIDMVTANFRHPEASLTVTHHHWMMVQGSYIAASQVAVEATMDRDISGSDQHVVAITRSKAQGRWLLSTASCTIYANGILTTSFCTNQSSGIWAKGFQMGKSLSESAFGGEVARDQK